MELGLTVVLPPHLWQCALAANSSAPKCPKPCLASPWPMPPWVASSSSSTISLLCRGWLRKGPSQAHKLQAAQSMVWQQLPPLWTSSTKALSVGDSSGTSLSLTPNPGTNAFPHREAATPLGIHSLPGLRQQSQKKGDRLFCPRK